MKLKDFHRLVKFMEQTTSDSDNECLTAIRMANKLLKENGADWKKIFARAVTTEVEDIEPASGAGSMSSSDAERKADRTEYTNHMFEKVLDGCAPGSFRSFILDIQAKFETSGYLTSGQYEALRRSYNRAISK